MGESGTTTAAQKRHSRGFEGTDDDPFQKFVGAAEAMTNGMGEKRGAWVTDGHNILLLHLLGKP